MLNPAFISLCLYYFILFMGNTVWFSYIGLYYSSINLTNAQIGVINAIISLTAILAQPIWGTIADRSKNKNFILQVALLLSAISIWLFPISGKNIWLLFLASVIISFFVAPTGSLGDSIALELANQEKFKFSTIRTIGSLGFALMSPIAGWILNIDIKLLFVMYSFFRFISSINLSFVPKVIGHDKRESKDGFRKILKDKKLLVFYIYIFILSCTAGFSNAFHVIYSKNIGLDVAFIGIGIMIGSFSQFPVMFAFDWLDKKIGKINLMIIAGVAYTARWLLYLYANNHIVFIIIWLLHGLTFMPLYLSISHYVQDTVKPSLKTRGQVLNYLVLSGFNTIIGSLLGGLIANAINIRTTFFLCSLLTFISTILFIIVINSSSVFKAPQSQVTNI